MNSFSSINSEEQSIMTTTTATTTLSTSLSTFNSSISDDETFNKHLMIKPIDGDLETSLHDLETSQSELKFITDTFEALKHQ